MNPEDLQSFSVEQRQIKQVWDKLQEIVDKYPPNSGIQTRYLFREPGDETGDTDGSRVLIYYTKAAEDTLDPDDDEFYGGFVNSDTDGLDSLTRPFFEISGHSSRVNYPVQTPFGVLPDAVIDASNTLFFSTNAFVIDSNNQARKYALITPAAGTDNLEDQLRFWGRKEEDVYHTDKNLAETNELFNISGSDLEQIKYLLSLINTGELQRVPDKSY